MDYKPHVWHHAREVSITDESYGFLDKGLSSPRENKPSAGHERPRVVVSKSRWASLLPILIHLIPLAATAAVASLNIWGFFIGAELEGPSGIDSLDILLLQVTAKLFEIAVVTSLALIVIDAVRNELLFADEGLPFGLLTARSRFSDVRYLVSRAFWQGIKGLSSRRKQAWFAWLIISCTLVSLFSGPSIALLLIPVMRHNWPAGKADFWLPEAAQTLWPLELDRNSIGVTLSSDATCQDPTPDALTNESLTYAGCVWAGYSALSEVFKQWHGFVDANITVEDGRIKRQLITFSGAWYDDDSDTWSITTNAAADLFMQYMTAGWLKAIESVQASHMRVERRFKNRAYNDATLSMVKTPVPVVRVACDITVDVNQTVLDQYGVWYPFLPPFKERDANFSAYMHYQLPVTLQNSSRIASYWSQAPNETCLLTNGSTTNFFPSAFLTLQIPTPSNNLSRLITCSIDAKWAAGINQGIFSYAARARYDPRPEVTSSFYPVLESGFDLPSYWKYHAQNTSAWLPVTFSTSWLDQLTPSLDELTPGWTTISNIISSLGIGPDDDELQPLTESIVATMVTDAMARIGYGQALQHVIAVNEEGLDECVGQADCYGYLNDSQIYNMLSRSGTVFDPPVNVGDNDIMPLEWTVTITGFSYRIDGLAYILGLIVLFVHAALALAHIFSLLVRRTWSSAWEKLEDLMMLCYLSKPEPDGVSVNSASGIKSKDTFRLPARVRAQQESTGREAAPLQLRLRKLVSFSENRSKIVPGKAY